MYFFFCLLFNNLFLGQLHLINGMSFILLPKYRFLLHQFDFFKVGIFFFFFIFLAALVSLFFFFFFSSFFLLDVSQWLSKSNLLFIARSMGPLTFFGPSFAIVEKTPSFPFFQLKSTTMSMQPIKNEKERGEEQHESTAIHSNNLLCFQFFIFLQIGAFLFVCFC